MRLPGATAFVTGAAQGLGKAFSESLLKHGASVCLSDYQVSKGTSVELDLKAKYGNDKVMFVACDVRSEDSLTNAFHKATSVFGNINLMVNNAGIGDESRYKDTININLTATVFGTALAIEHMRKDQGGKGGTIVNVSSTAGLTPVYFTPVYVASKYGVVGFTKSWAINPHCDEMGIQFSCLCPAFTDTAVIQFSKGAILYSDEVRPLMEMTGINKVEDVTNAFTDLVKKDNCNGDVITITVKDGVQNQTLRQR